MPKANRPEKPPPFTEDDPDWQERFQRGLERALSTPPKSHKPIGAKPKERPASKGRVHKGKTRATKAAGVRSTCSMTSGSKRPMQPGLNACCGPVAADPKRPSLRSVPKLRSQARALPGSPLEAPGAATMVRVAPNPDAKSATVPIVMNHERSSLMHKWAAGSSSLVGRRDGAGVDIEPADAHHPNSGTASVMVSSWPTVSLPNSSGTNAPIEATTARVPKKIVGEPV
jgi:hypothetical protein